MDPCRIDGIGAVYFSTNLKVSFDINLFSGESFWGISLTIVHEVWVGVV